MTQHAQTSIGVSYKIAKAYADRLARVVVVTPYMKSITESTVNSGTFDTFNNAGIPAPDNAGTLSDGGPGALTGTYAYYFTFWDNNRSVRGAESAQSGSIAVTARQITVDLTPITNEAANSRVTHIELWRNRDGGSTYYYVTRVTVATGSYTDNNTDATIGANDQLELDNDPPAVDTYGLVYTHKGYMFMAGPHNGIGGTEYDDDFTWSKLNNPDAWPSVNRAKIERGKYGHVRAIGSVGDALMFYKDSAIYELHFDTNPSGVTGDGYGKTVNTERGCLNHRCLVNVQGTHYVMDRKGIYQFRGGTDMVRLSMPLDRIWKRINWDESEKFCGVQDDDRVIWFVALDRDTEAKYGLVLDLNAIYLGQPPRWYVYKFDVGIRDACRTTLGNDATTAMYGMEWKTVAAFITEYGYVGYLVAGYRDLVAPQLTASGTVTSSTTSTVTDTGATFTRSNDGGHTESVVGAYLRFITWPSADKPGTADWSQPYRITTVNSATQVTVSPTFPSAPPAGAVYVIGAIPDARLATPLLSFGRPSKGKEAKSLALEFQPGGTTFTIGVEAELDRRGATVAAATASTSHYASTAAKRQIAVAMGGAIAGTNAGRMGAFEAPLPGRAFRYMQVILDGSGVDKPAVIDAMTIEVLDQES